MCEEPSRLKDDPGEEGKAEPELSAGRISGAVHEDQIHQGEDQESSGVAVARAEELLLEWGQTTLAGEKAEQGPTAELAGDDGEEDDRDKRSGRSHDFLSGVADGTCHTTSITGLEKDSNRASGQSRVYSTGSCGYSVWRPWKDRIPGF